MDREKALALLSKLEGKCVGSWIIRDFIDNGKSAAVYRASSSSEVVALKIFDDELIERYGDHTQIERIERELELVGHTNDNLVKILGGGVDSISGNHFIAMEYLEGKNLSHHIRNIDPKRILRLISQLADAAKFLEERGFAHRDIKPENIFLDAEHRRLVLLDLGVLRPLHGSTLTDVDGIQSFVGTLQYSSPEFLLRQEEDSLLGWRALTYYQIGGVLHDLIMKRPLFQEHSNPYARLVNAVQFQVPEIQNSAVPNSLVELARFCLLKDWRKRIDLLTWDSFSEPAGEGQRQGSPKQQVTNRAVVAQATIGTRTAPINPQQHDQIVADVIKYLKYSARAIRAENAVMPPLTVLAKVPNGTGLTVKIATSKSFGLASPLTIYLSVRVVDVGTKIVEVSACGIVGESADVDVSAKTRSFYTGSLDIVALHDAFENCLYDLVDQAQQMTLGDRFSAPIGPRDS